jgi:hypothetical protein
MPKSTLRHSATQAQELSPGGKKILARVLQSEEIQILVDVFNAEESGESFEATRLEITGSLERRGWIVREPSGSLRISKQTRLLLTESK